MNPFSNATIFVSIAAYRDPQLPLTVASLLQHADHPERLHIGIFNQVDVANDQHCLAPSHPQVTQHLLPHHKVHGACWARGYIWKKMLGQQDFALQIDSHSRFAQGWDSTLLAMYRQLGDERAIITHYPMGFNTETNVLDEPMYTYFNVQGFRSTQLPNITSGASPMSLAPKTCAPTAFVAAGSLFARASVFREVAYDPYIYFHGEEFTYAARLWTHGYNLYLPNRPFMWHDYQNLNQRTLHWQDHEQWRTKDRLAQQRCRHLLRIKPAEDVRALYHLEQYGLGFERSLEQYLAYAGLDLRGQQLSDKVKNGRLYTPVVSEPTT